MRRLAVILFLLGLFLEIAAFFIGQANDIPLVIKIISPNSSKAEAGIRALKKSKHLTPNEYGFKQISEFFFDDIVSRGPSAKLADVSLEKIRLQKYMYDNMDIWHTRPLTFELSNGKTYDWDIESLTGQINELKKGRLLKMACVIFFVGIVTQIVGFIIERKKGWREHS